jgi:hypothetical protein
MLFIRNLFISLYYIIYPNSKNIMFENDDYTDEDCITCNCNLCYNIRNISNFFVRKLKIV